MLLVLGTPLVLYGTKYASFSHIYTFAAGTFLLYLTVRIDGCVNAADAKKERRMAFGIGVAAGLLECLIAAVNASWMCPVTARFEAASDNQLYEFFIAQEQMEMEYLFDRWYISPKALILSPILSKAEETARQFTALNFFECSGQRQRMILSLLSDLPNGYEVDDFKDMIRLVSSVAKDAAMLCPDATLVFDAANDSSSKLEGKFFPKGLKINMYEASAI